MSFLETSTFVPGSLLGTPFSSFGLVSLTIPDGSNANGAVTVEVTSDEWSGDVRGP